MIFLVLRSRRSARCSALTSKSSVTFPSTFLNRTTSTEPCHRRQYITKSSYPRRRLWSNLRLQIYAILLLKPQYPRTNPPNVHHGRPEVSTISTPSADCRKSEQFHGCREKNCLLKSRPRVREHKQKARSYCRRGGRLTIRNVVIAKPVLGDFFTVSPWMDGSWSMRYMSNGHKRKSVLVAIRWGWWWYVGSNRALSMYPTNTKCRQKQTTAFDGSSILRP